MPPRKQKNEEPTKPEPALQRIPDFTVEDKSTLEAPLHLTGYRVSRDKSGLIVRLVDVELDFAGDASHIGYPAMLQAQRAGILAAIQGSGPAVELKLKPLLELSFSMSSIEGDKQWEVAADMKGRLLQLKLNAAENTAKIKWTFQVYGGNAEVWEGAIKSSVVVRTRPKQGSLPLGSPRLVEDLPDEPDEDKEEDEP